MTCRGNKLYECEKLDAPQEGAIPDEVTSGVSITTYIFGNLVQRSVHTAVPFIGF